MKRILYLTFYFEPDLCAGSFRNSPLAKELASQLEGRAEIDVFTTMPNRYASFQQTAAAKEHIGNLSIERIQLPVHQSGMADQAKSFAVFYLNVLRRTRHRKYDMVFASSSRLFTAYLGHTIARRQKIPLYVDVRDIFYDSMKDLLAKSWIKFPVLPLIKWVEHRTFTNAAHINLISPGFGEYFSRFPKATYTYFTNGIDDEFLHGTPDSAELVENVEKQVLYAGNIGEGQGLHKFIPGLARRFTGKYIFKIIGDGGALPKLKAELEREGCTNVIIEPPVGRKLLMEAYRSADFFLIHLNDYSAFKKVLPSKIFELAATDKPIIAGVGGFAAKFIKENVSNVILVEPCDFEGCAEQLQRYTYRREVREGFVAKYSRRSVNEKMAASIASCLDR